MRILLLVFVLLTTLVELSLADDPPSLQGADGSTGADVSATTSAADEQNRSNVPPTASQTRPLAPETNWLKDSLGGIVVLGAIGSILAVVILKILNYTARTTIPSTARTLRKHFAVNKRASRLVFEELKRRKNTPGIITAFAYLQSRLTLYLMLALCFTALLSGSYLVPLSTPVTSIASDVIRLVSLTMITLLLLLFRQQRSIIIDAFELFVGSIDAAATDTAEAEFDGTREQKSSDTPDSANKAVNPSGGSGVLE